MTNTNIAVIAGSIQNIHDWSKDGHSNVLAKVAIPITTNADGKTINAYLDVKGYGYQGDALKRLSEGDKVLVEGSLESYQNKENGTVYQIRANRVAKFDAGTMDKILVQGRLTADPELRSTKSGRVVANFTIAVDRSYRKDGEFETQTTFVKVVAWGDLAEGLALKKGQPVWVEGALRSTSYTDRNGVQRYSVEVNAESITAAGTGKSNGAAPKPAPAATATASVSEFEDLDDDDDGELPF